MDKSDKLKNPIRPYNNHHQSRDRTPTLDNLHSSHSPEKEVRIIPGPAEYIRKVVEDVGEDEDFTRGPWLSAVDRVLQMPLAIDLSGSMPGAIHHKIINEEGGYGKDIHVGAAVIVHNVSVFSPNRSHHSLHYLNITKKNLVKVFHKDTLYGNGSGVAVGGILDEEEIMKLLEEEERADQDLGTWVNGYVSDSFSDSEEERFRIEPEEDWELGWCGYVSDSFTDTD
ncbi:hypothetical protein CTI12_AA410030 [Artemisia annua]|uniref:Homologous recombination OB-fold protein OB-fold domain-containing protein n=1 Tax=Artemisia annua TaxID=35608 RepID=A0A2U1M790_ARTAN|nr:hypothetical protein CTI12_AA410030 [Artemisia annua]